MDTRKKVALSVVGFVLVAFIAVVSIVAVYAAQTQAINSQISVNYKVTDVIGSASAKYYVGNSTKLWFSNLTDMDTNGAEPGGETILDFNSKTSSSLSLTPQENMVLKADDHVFLMYKFKNTGPRVYNASLTFTGTIKNMAIYQMWQGASDEENYESRFYFEGYWDAPPGFNPDPGASTVNDGDRVDVSGDTDDNKTFTYDAGKVGEYQSENQVLGSNVIYVYFYIEVENYDNDAEFSGNFSWTLTALDEDRYVE